MVNFANENEKLFYGLEIAKQVIRNYPFKSLASHVIGYTQPITLDELNVLSKKGYQLNDSIGRTGIEFAYENYLRGEWGGQMLEVDAFGSVHRTLGEKMAAAGKDLVLTIDAGLQRAAEKALSLGKSVLTGRAQGFVYPMDETTDDEGE